MSTEPRLRKLIADHLGAEPEQITIDSSFTDDLGADSIDTVEIAMAVEDEFEIEVTDDEAAAAIEHEGNSFGKLLALVSAKLAGR